MPNNIKTKEEGFTIIEVLIVLAIAGIIMLIVFLAVPALQRNNRNTQRNNDAARVAGAINDCLANNNGVLTNCNDPSAAELTDYISIADNQQLVTFDVNTNYDADNVDTLYYAEGSRCDGNGVEAAGARAFAIRYNVETMNTPAPRCVGS